jgi:methanogenic corrinoid protein MtbC1
MRSIRSDRRHTDIEVLDTHPSEARVFGEWNMKVATQAPAPAAWLPHVMQPPQEIVEGLRLRPEAAPVLLVKLVAVAPADMVAGAAAAVASGAMAETVARLSLKQTTAALLKGVFLSAVVPALLERHPVPVQPARLWRVHRQAAELASLLIAADGSAAWALIAELSAHTDSAMPLYSTLFEPVARMLGDNWDSDHCSEFDVTLGLSRLQTAVRNLGADVLPGVSDLAHVPVVLIAPEPGELHGLGAALDSEVLWQAGWDPHCEFPATDKALQDLLAATWFDALDLSLSVAFRREDALPRVARTIARARRASRNPGLAVIVGGRVFVEQKTAGGQVGADGSCTTALDIEQAIQQGMSRRAAKLPS